MIEEVVATALAIDEKLIIRKNTIRQGEGSKRVCILTGTHGDELEGQYVCYRVNQILQQFPEALNGQVDIYPAINPLGIDTITRGIPNFDIDMNRIFPGDENGSMVEHVAHRIVEDLKGADMVIDIHSSNICLREIAQARINVNCADGLVPYAKMLNLDFIWIHEAATVLESTLAHSLNSIGTKCVVVEVGVGMRINNGLGEQLTDGIFNLMYQIGMWDRPVYIKHANPVLSDGDNVCFINADVSGIFITEIKNNHYVTQGQEIGRIVSPLTGEVLTSVQTPVDGLLFTLRAYPVVYEGSLIGRIHII